MQAIVDPTPIDEEIDPNVDPTASVPGEEELPPAEPQLDDDGVEKHFRVLKDSFELEDKLPRQLNLRTLKKAEFMWDGKQRLYWSEFEENYKAIDDLTLKEKEDLDIKDFDRVINVYRPTGESIISALSIEIPSVEFFPDDAQNPDDIATAKAYSKIAELIQKHNKAELLFIKALHILYNQGMVAAYNYTHQHESYGTIEKPTYEQQTIQTPSVDPETGQATSIADVIPVLTGYSKEAKSRECIKVFGGKNVQVPSWCTEQEQVPYLKLEFEQHVSLVKATYRAKFDEIKSEKMGSNYDERFARAKSFDQEQSDLVTVKTIWFRPWSFATTGSGEDFDFLVSKYPDGARVVYVNDEVMEIVPEALDDHWTITFPVLSDTLQSQPMGQGVIEIQELRNDGINLIDQKMRHSISETFAASDVLSFPNYSKAEKVPGQIFPVTPKAGRSASDSFFQTRTASLSQEDDIYIGRLDKDIQFVSGAFPSVYGGNMVGGSKTLGEYAQSRAQALQRLSTYWKMLSWFWNELLARAAREYAKNMAEDERFATKDGNSFLNVWIRKAELKGKIGSVEPEAASSFPLTASQKKDLLVSLIQYKDPTIAKVIFHPENGQLTRDALGMPELYIPGQGDRNKQLYEIQALCNIDPNTPPNPTAGPTVPTEPLIDDEPVHIQVMKSFLVDERGQALKESNSAAYANCLMHLQAHVQSVQQKMMQQTEQTAPGKPQPTNTTTTDAT